MRTLKQRWLYCLGAGVAFLCSRNIAEAGSPGNVRDESAGLHASLDDISKHSGRVIHWLNAVDGHLANAVNIEQDLAAILEGSPADAAAPCTPADAEPEDCISSLAAHDCQVGSVSYSFSNVEATVDFQAFCSAAHAIVLTINVLNAAGDEIRSAQGQVNSIPLSVWTPVHGTYNWGTPEPVAHVCALIDRDNPPTVELFSGCSP